MTSHSDIQASSIEIINSAIDMLLTDRGEDARHLLVSDSVSANPASFRKNVSLDRQAKVFTRDRFVCRYCGRRTLFVPVLRAVSSIMPGAFPYHPNWKMSECHMAYWRYGASIDHVIPIARGGDAVSSDNLVTSCYMCNSIKQNWLIDELRWRMLPVSEGNWDGLSSRLQNLCVLAQVTDVPYFAKWLHAIQRASQP